MEHESVFKGHVISLQVSEYGPSMGGVTFIRRPELTARGHHLAPWPAGPGRGPHPGDRPPGAGIAGARPASQARPAALWAARNRQDTHVRYLLSQSAGTTAVLLSGGALARIAEAAKLARALAPSIVVLEDCDLIAEDRSFGHGPQPLLFEVLDAMDGLDSDSDVAFVLTTNRVDMLERALAQRPGRVDLAVEIPMPVEHERLALLQLYARRLAFSTPALEAAAAQTDGHHGIPGQGTDPPGRGGGVPGGGRSRRFPPGRCRQPAHGRRRRPHPQPAGQRHWHDRHRHTGNHDVHGH